MNVLLLLLLLPHRLSPTTTLPLLLIPLSPPLLPSLLLLLFLLLLPPQTTNAESVSGPPTHPPKKKKRGKRCVPPVLRSPRPDPHTIHSSGLNNASAATDLKGSQEQFSTRNNTSLTVTMETNDGPGWLGGGGLEEGGEKRGDGEGGES